MTILLKNQIKIDLIQIIKLHNSNLKITIYLMWIFLKSNGSCKISYHHYRVTQAKCYGISAIGCQISSKCERRYHASLLELLISHTFGAAHPNGGNACGWVAEGFIVKPIFCIRSFVFNYHVLYDNTHIFDVSEFCTNQERLGHWWLRIMLVEPRILFQHLSKQPLASVPSVWVLAACWASSRRSVTSDTYHRRDSMSCCSDDHWQWGLPPIL